MLQFMYYRALLFKTKFRGYPNARYPPGPEKIILVPCVENALPCLALFPFNAIWIANTNSTLKYVSAINWFCVPHALFNFIVENKNLTHYDWFRMANGNKVTRGL